MALAPFWHLAPRFLSSGACVQAPGCGHLMGALGGEEVEVHAGDAHRVVQFHQFMVRGSYVWEAAGGSEKRPIRDRAKGAVLTTGSWDQMLLHWVDSERT
jgi:hypothetical protein